MTMVFVVVGIAGKSGLRIPITSANDRPLSPVYSPSIVQEYT
jgi:hypothetical protein